MEKTATGMTIAAACETAMDAAGWLASEPEMLGHFLAAAGMAPAALREHMDEPETLGAILDFLLMDDAWVLAAAEHARRPPQDFATARQALPGGDVPHWT